MANIFVIFVILHCLGDYYLQTKSIVKLKEEKYRFVLLHSLIYSIPGMLSAMLFENTNYLIYIILFCVLHLLIDTLKFFIKSKHYYPTEKKDREKHFLKFDITYFMDQFVHIISISILSIIFLQSKDLSIKTKILDCLNVSADRFVFIAKCTAAFLIILKPVSVTFYRIFNVDLLAKTDADGSGDNAQDKKKAIGAGSIIGYMERTVMMMLLIAGEYTAMGFIIAGKAIVRLKSNVKQEFLIIGTFYGIITTLFVYMVFFKI